MASDAPERMPAAIAQSSEFRAGRDEWNANASDNISAVPLMCVIVVSRNALNRREANPPKKSLNPQAHVAARLSAAGANWESAGTRLAKDPRD